MRNILVIEDDDFMSRSVELILRRQGYTITLARNGKEGLALLQQGRFDLVITDLMLPFANGLELISKLKHNLRMKHTPVIILSAITHEKTVRDGFDLGAADYLKKPFTPSELVSRVNRLIEKEPHVI